MRAVTVAASSLCHVFDIAFVIRFQGVNADDFHAPRGQPLLSTQGADFENGNEFHNRNSRLCSGCQPNTISSAKMPSSGYCLR